MGESMKIALRDALKMVGIVESTRETSDIPQASWDLYEMIQACIQVFNIFFHLLVTVINKTLRNLLFLISKIDNCQ